jgi:Fe-S cluster biosynthesis and repair protein YggX
MKVKKERSKVKKRQRNGSPSFAAVNCPQEGSSLELATTYGLTDNTPSGEIAMADDSCTPTPAPSEPVKPGTRMVHCVKFGKDMPGLDRVPWRGEIGKRVFENVSKEAWKLWVEYSKMLMNEYRLNPIDPNSQKIMEEQMEQFFFGEGAKLPEGYVPPKAKG